MKMKLTKDPSHKGYYQDENGNLYVFRFGGRPIRVDDYREDKPKEDVQVDSVEVDQRQVIDHRKEAPISENKIFIKEAEKEYEEREAKIKSEKSDTEKNHLESLQRDLVHEINNTEKRADLEYNSMIDAVEQVNARGGYHSKEELYDDLAGSLGITTEEAKKVWDEKHPGESEKKDNFKYSRQFSMDAPVNDFEAANQYLTEDDMTQYLPENLKEKINKVEWQLDDESSGEIIVMANKELSEEEENQLKEWIDGQNSDGLGEGFEQQEFAESYYDPYSGDGPFTRYEAEEEISRRIEEMDVSDYWNYIDDSEKEAGVDNYIEMNGLEYTEDEDVRWGYRAEIEDDPFSYISEDAIYEARDLAARDNPDYDVEEWYNMCSIRSYSDFEVEELTPPKKESQSDLYNYKVKVKDKNGNIGYLSGDEDSMKYWIAQGAESPNNFSKNEKEVAMSRANINGLEYLGMEGPDGTLINKPEHIIASENQLNRIDNGYNEYLKQRYGTDNIDIINAGKEEEERVPNYGEAEKGLEKYLADNFGKDSEIYRRNFNEQGFPKTIKETRDYLETNTSLAKRFSGTIQTLQAMHPDWPMSKIMEKIRLLDEE
jgi:hypothetical protein